MLCRDFGVVSVPASHCALVCGARAGLHRL